MKAKHGEKPKTRKCPVSPLKAARLSNDPPLLQRELSALSGVPQGAISYHETGQRSMKFSTALKYAKVLNISALELME